MKTKFANRALILSLAVPVAPIAVYQKKTFLR
jgi:hypothetical protein